MSGISRTRVVSLIFTSNNRWVIKKILKSMSNKVFVGLNCSLQNNAITKLNEGNFAFYLVLGEFKL